MGSLLNAVIASARCVAIYKPTQHYLWYTMKHSLGVVNLIPIFLPLISSRKKAMSVRLSKTIIGRLVATIFLAVCVLREMNFTPLKKLQWCSMVDLKRLVVKSPIFYINRK